MEDESGLIRKKASGGPGSGSDEEEDELVDRSGDLGAILKRKKRIKKRQEEVQRREQESHGWCCGYFDH